MDTLNAHRMTVGVIAITVAMLVALGVTMLTYGHSEGYWRDTLRWDQGIAGASEQVAGIQAQRAAQALYAATGKPRYRTAFERGVRTETAGSRAVLRVGDARINSIAARAQVADRQYDRVVQARLFPAVAIRDPIATRAALVEADRLVEVGYRFAIQIAARVRSLRADDVREAKASAGQARIVGLVALALALLAGIPGTTLLVETQRRRETQRERERLLKLTRMQNEDLRRVDREKDSFIASISHELRTPLTSILGYTELVGDDATNLSEEQRRFLAIVDRNAGRLLRLVNDLLLAAQIDAGGELQIERDEVDLRALAVQAVESAGPAASMDDIELRLSADQPVVIEGDEVRIAQVIDNLLSNAMKFTPNGGRVAVRLSSDGETARLEVADTGMGMTPDEQSRLFERFYRTESATQGAIQGSGLGLAISQAIAHAHGGAITVESETGAGSTFTLAIPLIGPGTVTATAAEHTQSSRS